MAAGEAHEGRRVADAVWGGELPLHDLRPGDYWRYVNESGEPIDAGEDARARGNLTGGVWGVYVPRSGIGTLRLHTVREHDDGTISVRAGDGSSNSILQGDWHGYIERGEWREV